MVSGLGVRSWFFQSGRRDHAPKDGLNRSTFDGAAGEIFGGKVLGTSRCEGAQQHHKCGQKGFEHDLIPVLNRSSSAPVAGSRKD